MTAVLQQHKHACSFCGKEKDIVKKLIGINSPEVSVSIVWYFEDDDDDNIDLGKSIERDTKTKFTYIVLEQD
jgi:hypothetical protein